MAKARRRMTDTAWRRLTGSGRQTCRFARRHYCAALLAHTCAYNAKPSENAMSILADLFVASAEEARQYAMADFHQSIKARLVPAEYKGLTTLELGTFWALLEGSAWSPERHDFIDESIEGDDGSWLYRFPERSATETSAATTHRTSSSLDRETRRCWQALPDHRASPHPTRTSPAPSQQPQGRERLGLVGVAARSPTRRPRPQRQPSLAIGPQVLPWCRTESSPSPPPGPTSRRRGRRLLLSRWLHIHKSGDARSGDSAEVN